MATSGTFERPISIFIEIFPLNKGNLGLSFSPPAGTAAVSFNFFTKIHSIKAGDFVCRDGHFLFFLLKKSEKLPPPGDVSPRDLPKRNVHILLTHSNDWNDVSSSRRSLQLVKITGEVGDFFPLGLSPNSLEFRNEKLMNGISTFDSVSAVSQCATSILNFLLNEFWKKIEFHTAWCRRVWRSPDRWVHISRQNLYSKIGMPGKGWKGKQRDPKADWYARQVCGDTWCGWGIHHSIGAI